MNAPEAGTVKEYLANEEDTVTVGQDLVKLELGGPPEGGEKQAAGQEPKAPAPQEQPSSSDPEPKKDDSKAKAEPAPPSPPPKESKHREELARNEERERKAEKSKSSPPPEKESSKPPEQESAPKSAYGSRDERRVRYPARYSRDKLLTLVEGQDESHAFTDR